MAKKPTTREELLAQLDALDNSTEVATLKAEVVRLTEENASYVSQRRELERDLKHERDAMQIIRDAVHKVDRKNRPVGHGTNPALDEAAARASRMSLTTVRYGIQRGTHDPATGLPYTAETKPLRDMSAGSSKATQAELARVFPELMGPEVAGVEW